MEETKAIVLNIEEIPPEEGSVDYMFSYTEHTIYNVSGLHSHTFYEFFLVTGGTALHLVNNAIQQLSKGDFFLIRAQDVHTHSYYDSEQFQIVNLGFTQPVMLNLLRFFEQSEKMVSLLQEPMPPQTHLEGEAYEEVCAMMREARPLIGAGNALREKYHIQCILAMLMERCFFRYEPQESARAAPEWLSSLLIQMQSLENLKAGYPRMRELSHCSANHLSRSMQQFCGMTPTDYVNEQRLNYAVYLLRRTSMDMLAISEECGFSNLSHFYHLFKKQFDCAPGQFRRERAMK